jgi:hypothetical protein
MPAFLRSHRIFQAPNRDCDFSIARYPERKPRMLDKSKHRATYLTANITGWLDFARNGRENSVIIR